MIARRCIGSDVITIAPASHPVEFIELPAIFEDLFIEANRMAGAPKGSLSPFLQFILN
jgi:hypothetical protein